MFRIILSKLLTLVILIRNPKIPSQQRWFIRFTFKGWLYQLKYFKKDYIIKKPYKIISFNGEFQQELIRVLPFAYWHYKNGTLIATESSTNMAPFYFFSPSHKEVYNQREYLNNYTLDIPNSAHSTFIDHSKWLPVPLKEFYKNEVFCYKKPILVIANRYNTEWGEDPISFFSLNNLKFIIETLIEKYQIVYNRPESKHIANDSSEILYLNDHKFLREEFPEVLLMEDLFEDHKEEVKNFNCLQLMLYANCNNFISIHGGTATLASYFGGTNLIYSKKGHEHPLNEFQNIFPQLSKTKIFLASTEESLKEMVLQKFL